MTEIRKVGFFNDKLGVSRKTVQQFNIHLCHKPGRACPAILSYRASLHWSDIFDLFVDIHDDYMTRKITYEAKHS